MIYINTLFTLMSVSWVLLNCQIVQSAGAVEYTDYFSAEG